jgi:dTDP-glucose 4,6-dehydratase
MFMDKKTTLITGAAGFLGSHLCDRFIKEGHHVIAMDNLITGDIKNIEHHLSNDHFEFIEHDVTKHIEIPGELDYILHFASPASPIDYLKIPIQTLKLGHWVHIIVLDLQRQKKQECLLRPQAKFMAIL